MTWWIVGFACWLLLGMAAAMTFGRLVRFVDVEQTDSLDVVLSRARVELAELVGRQRLAEPLAPAAEAPPLSADRRAA